MWWVEMYTPVSTADSAELGLNEWKTKQKIRAEKTARRREKETNRNLHRGYIVGLSRQIKQPDAIYSSTGLRSPAADDANAGEG